MTAILWEIGEYFAFIRNSSELATAYTDTLGDMAAGKPMDRLICGDVGFGKTEVALRAAFITAFAGAQVAVIVPTTLLARQHFRTFSERSQTSSSAVRSTTSPPRPRRFARRHIPIRRRRSNC